LTTFSRESRSKRKIKSYKNINNEAIIYAIYYTYKYKITIKIIINKIVNTAKQR